METEPNNEVDGSTQTIRQNMCGFQKTQQKNREKLFPLNDHKNSMLMVHK